MNTVRIIKSDAIPVDAHSQFSVSYEYAYMERDTIPIETNWTAEEVAVLAGLDLHKLVKIYNEKYFWNGYLPTFDKYLRSHIQAEIAKRKGE